MQPRFQQTKFQIILTQGSGSSPAFMRGRGSSTRHASTANDWPRWPSLFHTSVRTTRANSPAMSQPTHQWPIIIRTREEYILMCCYSLSIAFQYVKCSILLRRPTTPSSAQSCSPSTLEAADLGRPRNYPRNIRCRVLDLASSFKSKLLQRWY